LMAHKLMHNHMAYVGEVPWHGLGKSVPAEVSAQEMIAAAGLDWQVRKEPALWANNHQMGPYKPYLVVRERTAHESQDVALGFVGHGYEILQNDEAFEFFEPFIDSRLAHFETAGALRQALLLRPTARSEVDSSCCSTRRPRAGCSPACRPSAWHRV
jgi:hypothetical protein